ncbi:MAG: type III-A CRISPR-associated protein Cas10/Csm1, partial [Caldimicrobium sp.]|nr:type III-A CRISPR-associated protein Cas10/Csm1 [Caldimicrobium sp.]
MDRFSSDPLHLKVILASLLHDIGKLYERAIKLPPEDYIKQNSDFNQLGHGGEHRYLHALSTAYFIENFGKFIPKELRDITHSSEDALVNLASLHHEPSSELHSIIYEANLLSKGYEKGTLEEIKSSSESTTVEQRLFSLFEDISLSEDWKKKLEDYKYVYEIAPISPESIFPINRDPNITTQHFIDTYTDLLRKFEEAFKNLPHRENPYLWLTHLNCLLMKYLSLIPMATVSAINEKSFLLSDVSLYDHSYLTASIASALYVFHKGTNTLQKEKISDRELEKFLLIEGNFYGIQSFIFSAGGATNKFAAKLLRGRSFMISLLSELTAELILEELGLTFVSVLYNTAGKFLILAPNLQCIEEKLKDIEFRINDWLYHRFYGETSIGIVYLKAKPKDFITKEGYKELYKKLGELAEEKKYQKFDLYYFGGAPSDYFKSFSGAGVCELCGKRPSQEK